MRKALAFIKRDFVIATSYKTEFAIRLFGIAMVVPLCFFVGKGVNVSDAGDAASRYGNSYFSFLLIGLGLLGYLTISLRTFSQSIRESQMMGTLEIVLLSPTSITQLVIYSSLWIYLFLTLRFAIYLLLGVLFGMDLGNGNALSALVVLAMSIPAFAALGVASAALIVVIKRGEGVNYLLSVGSLVLGGVLFPIAVLPEWLQVVANVLPITHSLEAMRLALFDAATIVDLWPQLVVLALFALIVLPLSLGLFLQAVKWNKVAGTLANY